MNRKLLIIILILVVLVLAVFFAGQFFSKREVVPLGEIVVPEEEPTKSSETVEQSTDAYEVTVRYPTAGTPEAIRVADFIQDEMDAFVAQAERDMVELRDIGFTATYALDIDYNLYEVGGVTSYVVSEYQYTGGANGNVVLTTFVFDEQGRELGLVDVVPMDVRDNLMVEVRGQLRDAGGFPDIVDELTFEDLRIFYLTDTELVIGFSEYEVAPGAAGAVEVAVPIETYVEL